MHQHQYQPPFVPQGPMQGQMGQPRAPLGAPQRHQREVVRGIEAHFRPIITNNPSPVVIPHRADGRTFEVRTTALQCLPKFKGLATEEPYFHLETYDSICNTIGGQGFSADDVKLVLFQFSLEDKAKRWFHTLPSASIFTWADMQQIFLDEYYTSQKTNDARRGLRSFQQQSGEMFHEAFERFNMMLRNCPHHGIQLWELLNAFHEGLSSEDARDLMSITNGTFGTNYEHVDWAFLEQMAVNSKRKDQSSRRARHVTQRPQVHGIESGNVQTTNQVYNVCTNCNEIGHTAEVCIVGVVDEQVEEVNAIQGGGGRNFNMNSNTYHPGLRNHLNFRYGNVANQANPNFQGAQGNFAPRQKYNQGNYRGGNNYGYQGQFQQTGQGGSSQSSSSGNEVMDMLRAMQQDMQKRNQLDEVRMQKDEVRDKSIQSLTTQMDLVDRCNPHEYEEEGMDVCLCDFSEQVHAYALRVEEEKQDAMALREGRPPWTHQFEGLPAEIDSGTKPSLEEPPKLELKDLPSHLKYAFLGDNDILSVIIASNLELVQEQALLEVLKENKGATG
ncbi:uncharacterized protein LOC118479572 [Helianthus annuus]|uniref:uncharacterized protein LOC118479572 n=1 Tax=Helianthus annuus TaxID=4232 RepID=UPI001653213C|nr:uncharacterized protein LOC118479572 [Helianthus annuus]